jgi:hypothetical protein
MGACRTPRARLLKISPIRFYGLDSLARFQLRRRARCLIVAAHSLAPAYVVDTGQKFFLKPDCAADRSLAGNYALLCDTAAFGAE